jgi:hypothetical protein
MKSIILLALPFLFTSCAKNYECRCEILDKTTSTSKTETYNINKKKQEAIDQCNAGDENSTSFAKECNITNQ